MKLSASLPDDDVEFLDDYSRTHGCGSRSAALHEAVSLLRASELADDYAAAWDEWRAGDGELWEATVDDGIESTG